MNLRKQLFKNIARIVNSVKIVTLVKIVKLGQNWEIWSKLWSFGQNCEIWSKSWFFFKLLNLVKNYGRGYVIHNLEWMTDKGGYRAARAAKNLNIQTHSHCATTILEVSDHWHDNWQIMKKLKNKLKINKTHSYRATTILEVPDHWDVVEQVPQLRHHLQVHTYQAHCSRYLDS